MHNHILLLLLKTWANQFPFPSTTSLYIDGTAALCQRFLLDITFDQILFISFRIIEQLKPPHITHDEWVNYVLEWQNLQFNVDSEQQIFEKRFHGRLILLLEYFLPEIGWKDIAEKIFSYFRFHAWSGMWSRVLRLISQHTTY